ACDPSPPSIPPCQNHFLLPFVLCSQLSLSPCQTQSWERGSDTPALITLTEFSSIFHLSECCRITPIEATSHVPLSCPLVLFFPLNYKILVFTLPLYQENFPWL
uniref:Uncharacterized protein n=1 Tax=Pelusios castaneus TaxID=367368 RepID=A0A8C8RQH2_9SAUR